MAALVVSSSRKVNPLSLTSAMNRAAGQNEFNKKLSQYAAYTQQIRKVTKDDAIAQQAEPVEKKSQAVFPYVSTLAMMQIIPAKPISSARVSEYQAMAALAQQDQEISLGNGLDMLA